MGPRRALLAALGASLAATAASRAVAAPVRASTVDLPLDGPFTSLRLEVPGDYAIRPASTPYLRLTAEPEVAASIRARRRGDELVVEAARSFRAREPIRIEIGYRTLRRARVEGAADVAIDGPRDGALEVVVRGAGDVHLAGLNLSALRVDIEGSATVTADGAATEQTVGVKGAATYEAGRLKSRRVAIELDGSSDATVDAAERLVARVDGTSTVRYRGNPRVEQTVGGVGSVERI